MNVFKILETAVVGSLVFSLYR